MGWIKVCEANSLSNGDLIGFDHISKRILIAKAHDKIYATDGICTHEYADLSTGFLNEEEKMLHVHCTCRFSNWMMAYHKIRLLKRL